MGGGEGGNAALSILPVESSNSIVVRGDPALIQRVVQMVLELDRRAESTGDVRVVMLQHASAEQLLPVLQQLVGQPQAAGSGDAPVSKIGRAHVCTPVTNAHLVCRLLLEKKKKEDNQ